MSASSFVDGGSSQGLSLGFLLSSGFFISGFTLSKLEHGSICVPRRMSSWLRCQRLTARTHRAPWCSTLCEMLANTRYRNLARLVVCLTQSRPHSSGGTIFTVLSFRLTTPELVRLVGSSDRAECGIFRTQSLIFRLFRTESFVCDVSTWL